METHNLEIPDGIHMCEIFFCDKRRERQCCYYCPGKKKCKNQCLNNPEKCGEHFIQRHEKEGKES